MQPEERRDDTALRKALADTVIIRQHQDLGYCAYPQTPRCQNLALYGVADMTLCIVHFNWVNRA